MNLSGIKVVKNNITILLAEIKIPAQTIPSDRSNSLIGNTEETQIAWAAKTSDIVEIGRTSERHKPIT